MSEVPRGITSAFHPLQTRNSLERVVSQRQAVPERGEEVSQRLTRFGYRAGAACSRVFTIARENVCRKVKLRTASPATGGESVDPSSWSAISFCKAALVTWSNFST